MYYKLLSQNMTSHNNTQWELGVKKSISIPSDRMCSDQVFHCYNHPALAAFFNVVHAAIRNPRLFQIEVDKIINHDGMKFASKEQTLVRELALPQISKEQMIEFAMRVVLSLGAEHIAEPWVKWMENWLNGKQETDCDKLYSVRSTSTQHLHRFIDGAVHRIHDAAGVWLSQCSGCSSHTLESFTAPSFFNQTLAIAVFSLSPDYPFDQGNSDYYCAFNKNLIEIMESVLDKPLS